MKSVHSSNGLSIWLSCSIFVLIMTVCVAIADHYFGAAGVAVFIIIPMFLLSIYRGIIKWRARRKEYNRDLVIGITNNRIIYLIINIALIVGWIFSTLISWVEDGVLCIPKGVYCFVILFLAVVLSIKPIQPFVKKKKYHETKRYKAPLIDAFVPRFVILYTFVAYYFFSFANYSSSSEIIPSICVMYIGIERLISMFQIVSEYSKQEYYSMFRDTAKQIKKNGRLDKI